MSRGSPFRDEVGLVPSVQPNLVPERVNAPIRVHPEEVDAGALCAQDLDFSHIDARSDDTGRMEGVLRVDHRRHLFHRRPNVQIAVKQVHLVAHTPHQQGGMVFEFPHDFPKAFELVLTRPVIAVIEPVPLMAHPQAHHDHESMGLGGIQHVTAPV